MPRGGGGGGGGGARGGGYRSSGGGGYGRRSGRKSASDKESTPNASGVYVGGPRGVYGGGSYGEPSVKTKDPRRELDYRCTYESRKLLQCLRLGGDTSQCQFYVDAYTKCRQLQDSTTTKGHGQQAPPTTSATPPSQ